MKRPLTVALCACLPLACAHEVESPSVTLQRLEPNLVCNAQRVEPVASLLLHGSGFTPLPTNVLAEPPELHLPKVTLQQSQSLTGSNLTGDPLEFSGDPDGDLASNLSWQSRSEMTLRVTEEPPVSLEPGLYDVTVTNPDGTRSSKVEQALAVVPPPVITELRPVPPALCTAQAQRELVVVGENLLTVGRELPIVTLTSADETIELPTDVADDCQDVPGEFAGGSVALCQELTLRLPRDLPAGTYDVVVTSPAPAACSSSEPIQFVVVPPPFVTEVEPAAVCVDQGLQEVTVTGGSFARISAPDAANPLVTISDADGEVLEVTPDGFDGCEPPDRLDEDFGVLLCDGLTFSIAEDALPPGNYTLTVTNPVPVGCSSTEDIAFTVNPPPTVESVAPATVCSGGSLVLAIGQGFADGAQAFLECPQAGTLTASQGLVNDDGTQLSLTFPGGVSAGEVCDLVVQNPDGCEDRPEPHQTVTGTDGPIIYNVDPHVAYDGIDTRVTLFVTALDPPFSVTIWPSDGDGSETIELSSERATRCDADGTNCVDRNVVQAIIPAGTAAGEYDISIDDQSGCMAIMQRAVRVTADNSISDGTVVPPFGQSGDSVAVTISLGSAGPGGVPRVFLNPTSGDEPAIQLQGVTVVDDATLTALVPGDASPGSYDLVVVWEAADGTVAVLSGAYQSVTDAPPVIAEVVPQSVINQAGQTVEARGTGFAGSSASLRCQSGGTTVTLEAAAGDPSCTDGNCTLSVTFDAGTLSPGDVCLVRVTNQDGSYGEFSAVGVTNSSFNLSSPVAGRSLATPRRALVSAAVKATGASRFLYAIGGDDGAVELDSVEVAPVDVFGNMQPWFDATQSLGAARAFAGTATIGRYVYVFGGREGGTALSSAERALVLSPEETPAITTVDLCLAGGTAVCFGDADLGGGLPQGTYAYRVAAIIDADDPTNLGGETLASDPVILRLRQVLGRNAVVKLDWTSPKDALGDALSGIAGYRIYRTPVDGAPGGDELLLAEVDGATTSFVDDDGGTLGTRRPRPQGSTSAWQALPDLSVGREGVAGAAARDPAEDDTWHVYALLGRDGALGHTTYEYLTVTVLPNGRQTVAGSWTSGAEESAEGRWQHGAFVVDDVVSNLISTQGETWLYLGSGLLAGGGTSSVVEAGQVEPGGELGSFADSAAANDSVADLSSVRVGYGTAAAAGSLFMFGGSRDGDDALQNAIAARFQGAPPALANNSWNNEGLSLTSARTLMGSSIQSAFIFLVAGDDGMGPLATTETVVW